MKETLGNRMRFIRDDVLHESRPAIAEKLGVSVVTIQNYENDQRDPPSSFMVRFAQLTGASLLWLLEGTGPEMKGGTANLHQATKDAPVPHICCDTLGNPVDLSEFVFIPRYNLRAAAGHGAAVAGEKPMFSISFRRYWIDNYLRIDPKDLSVLSVKGDSMEGVLNDRDVILVNHADTSPTSGLYVLRIDGDLLVKRVQKLIGGRIEVKSANEAYSPFVVDTNAPGGDFAVIGRVVWFGRQL
jgi:phage repressor protein C with HTH and peptisase S24 domain